ncbi:MAG: CsbD family protein [Bauldia sp.]|jgi:uncharacterized protein YjbJ (UPF0337 family)|nr:CsbD family protein [Bauldia sp.]
MRWNAVQNRWNTMVPSIQASWSELTDDDLEEVRGDMAGLASLIHERYGMPRGEAERQVASWLVSR